MVNGESAQTSHKPTTYKMFKYKNPAVAGFFAFLI